MKIIYNKCPDCGYEKENMPNICPACGFDYYSYILKQEAILEQKAKKKAEEEAKKKEEEAAKKAEKQSKKLDLKLDKLDNNNASYKREGHKIYFGSYFINNDEIKEPIEWDILEEKDGKALIISHYILDTIKFDDESNNYEKSYIRNWLNNDFYDMAFNDNEKAIINTTIVDNSLDSTGDKQNKSICDDTNDKIFLLACKEAETYYKSDEERKAKGTEYSIEQGLWVIPDNGNNSWWLRSPNYRYYPYSVYIVDYDGDIGNNHVLNIYHGGVRPACWINL